MTVPRKAKCMDKKERVERDWLKRCEISTQNTLDTVSATPSCAWCKDPDQRLYRSGLCAHCYRIERQIAQLQSPASSSHKCKPPNGHTEYKLRVVKKKRELALSEGHRYGEINKQAVDDLRLEYAFSGLAELVGSPQLFHGECHSISLAFQSSVKRRYLFYLVSKVLRIYEKRFRTRIAERELLEERLAESRKISRSLTNRVIEKK